jgi:hypothetical protein
VIRKTYEFVHTSPRESKYPTTPPSLAPGQSRENPRNAPPPLAALRSTCCRQPGSRRQNPHSFQPVSFRAGPDSTKAHKPCRCDGDFDSARSHHISQILSVPVPRRRPIGRPATHDERPVSGDISHEFKGTGFQRELVDGGDVQLVVADDEILERSRGHGEY